MPFTSYASVAEVAVAYHIRVHRTAFVKPAPVTLAEHFRSELAFTLSEVPFDGSEAAASETLIYPFLREVWKPYRDVLTLWSYQPIHFDDDLAGTPDYMLARRSPLGPLIPDRPHLLVVEAKKDDFTRGWGQCLAAMLTAQKINALAEQTVFGITTNGRVWECGQLHGDVYTHDPRSYTLEDVDTLAAAIHSLVLHCREQALRCGTAA